MDIEDIEYLRKNMIEEIRAYCTVDGWKFPENKGAILYRRYGHWYTTKLSAIDGILPMHPSIEIDYQKQNTEKKLMRIIDGRDKI